MPSSEAVGRVIVGQREPLEKMLIAMLCNGHVLLEGVPGIAKTMMVNTLAQALGARSSRIQFTPDLLPGDLVGTQIYRHETGVFETHRDRSSPTWCSPTRSTVRPPRCKARCWRRCRSGRSRSAGRRTSCRSRSWCWPRRIRSSRRAPTRCRKCRWTASCSSSSIEYPTHDEEHEILRRVARTNPVTSVAAVATLDDILAMRKTLDAVHLDEKLELYILRLVAATRNPAALRAG